MIEHFAANTDGRDFVVGDIHGCFSKLEAELADLQFDPACDRLFSVGDLVDRGPDSELAIEWLGKPWFHAVRGNHEQMAIDAASGAMDAGCYIQNGGAWFLALTKPEQRAFADAFEALPIGIEVETKVGLIGVLHADCPFDSWRLLAAELSGERAYRVATACTWSRERITSKDDSVVAGVAGVFVGHTPVKQPVSLGNVHYIDTGAVFGRALTIVQIN
jgi:serine/threonine protein phosphatase 1